MYSYSKAAAACIFAIILPMIALQQCKAQNRNQLNQFRDPILSSESGLEKSEITRSSIQFLQPTIILAIVYPTAQSLQFSNLQQPFSYPEKFRLPYQYSNYFSTNNKNVNEPAEPTTYDTEVDPGYGGNRLPMSPKSKLNSWNAYDYNDDRFPAGGLTQNDFPIEDISTNDKPRAAEALVPIEQNPSGSTDTTQHNVRKCPDGQTLQRNICSKVMQITLG